ncbi:TIGR03086 family metal-binding protein [Streptomyces gilvosporeus]|uniref:TIGR03086 family protein n=1 Tax=Streptomyces gilvosporeus TaxID=553510 RepID=A0A1V0TX17_9ACTN|nr:TIGR03086 family metal-binding protein [Streptomyces gilvosporeus]ARF57232.1 TIGR03086 family protein [Streptomyces gilvosporeus]
MPTNPNRRPSEAHAALARLTALNAEAVRGSLAAVHRLTPADLPRRTPCADWTLADLLAHMTVQHRGFAAAARGDGQDPAHWSPRPLAEDPIADYAAAADDVLAAFAEVTDPDQTFALPEATAAPAFPALHAIGFHFIDYVVHGWDVARTLDLPYAPEPALLEAALPVAHAVPSGDDYRLAPGSAFAPPLPDGDGASLLDRILTTLGRSPSWSPSCPA